ncbi:hypothetical protein [Arthrobacter sp. CAN_C5]|uniref:hypothetical protein n=1 Tax=Arthrobacter sp. CAN_C5 TaxID=2760706 RepID=UPI001AE5D3BB|nr:hypothetical protein [Arthrobacter sp. CAN_C5]MBP2215965.1 hypothetical protein [Arthrobacter sp. CAN_C5]
MNTSGLIDPHLSAVVQAAENGAVLQRVVVVCGSTLYVGIPVSTAKFTHTNLTEFGVEFFKDAGNWKTPRQEKEAIADQRANEVIRAISPEDSTPTMDVLSLCPAQVLPAGMASYEVPAVRVNLHQVDSWWVAPFVEHPAKFRGGGVGVSF